MTISTPTGPEQILGRDYPTLNGPVHNLNGAPLALLIEDHIPVIEAARVLLKTMRHALPHGRDYQTAQLPVSYTHDRMVMEGMIQDVENIRKQFERVLERLVHEKDAADSARKARRENRTL